MRSPNPKFVAAEYLAFQAASKKDLEFVVRYTTNRNKGVVVVQAPTPLQAKYKAHLQIEETLSPGERIMLTEVAGEGVKRTASVTKKASDWEDMDLENTSIPDLVQGSLDGMRDEIVTLEGTINDIKYAWRRKDMEGLAAMGVIPKHKLKILYRARDAQDEKDEELLESILLDL